MNRLTRGGDGRTCLARSNSQARTGIESKPGSAWTFAFVLVYLYGDYISVQCNGGFPSDIILLTLHMLHYDWGTQLNSDIFVLTAYFASYIERFDTFAP